MAWLASILSITGIILNAKKNIACWYVWTASNVLWVYHTITAQEYAALLNWMVFLFANIYGLRQWKTNKK